MSNTKLDTPTILKVAAMFVAIPRYVGLMLYLSGFVFAGNVLIALHAAEAVAGLSLAVLEGFALAYILSRRQLGFSKNDKTILYVVVALLLILLPICAAPYLLFLFDGSSLFVAQQTSRVPDVFKFVWATATASMPILIIIGVALVEKDPVDVQLMIAEREANLEQTLSRIKAETQQTVSKIEAETEQTILQYKLQAQQAQQARAEHKAEKQQIESNPEQQPEQEQHKTFVCESCGRGFDKIKALAGHTGHCKARAREQQQNGKAPVVEVS